VECLKYTFWRVLYPTSGGKFGEQSKGAAYQIV